MPRKVSFKKFNSHQEADAYNLKQNLRMSASKRLSEIEDLRKIYYQMKGYEYPQRLRRTFRIIRKAQG